MVSLSPLHEIPSNNVILLVGPPGSGKTTFCEQTILQNLAIDKAIIFVTTEYDPSKAEVSLREKGLGSIEPDLPIFIDAYNETVGISVSDRADTIYADCNDLQSMDIAISKLTNRIGKKDILLVFDSLTSPYLFNGSEILRFMKQTLTRFAAKGNAVLACMDTGCGKEEDVVAMMTLANGIIKMEIEEDKQILNVMKHPKVRLTKIEVPIEPERLGIVKRDFNPGMMEKYFQAYYGGEETFWRKEVGDYVNLFWPNLVPWSGMLWDPKRFPTIFYEANRDDTLAGMKFAEENEEFKRVMYLAFGGSLRARFFLKFMPKNFSKVKDMKKIVKGLPLIYEKERSGVVEYLEDASKTDEHYFRVYENFNCWGFENVSTTMASYIPPMLAGQCKAFEYMKGLKREWNAIETKCIGLGDPYCEIKLVPGPIDELNDVLEKDSSVLERIHDNLMHRLMAFLIEDTPLFKTRPKLGNDIYLHPVWHTMGGENIPAMARIWSERYQMALRMGGAKAGKEVGEHLIEAGIREDDAVKRVLHLLEHCKAGKMKINETIRMNENCENVLSPLLPRKLEEPACYFTTGFLNGFFSTVKNLHVKETKCITVGDPYCEWEFQ